MSSVAADEINNYVASGIDTHAHLVIVVVGFRVILEFKGWENGGFGMIPLVRRKILIF